MTPCTQRRRTLLLCALASLAACNPTAFDDLYGSKARDIDAEQVGADPPDERGTDADTQEPEGEEEDASTSLVGGMDAGAPDAARDADMPTDSGGDAQVDGTVTVSEAGPPECPRASDSGQVKLSSTELGTVSIPDVTLPVASGSTRVGSRILWLFVSPRMAVWSNLLEEPSKVPVLRGPVPYVSVLPDGALPPDIGVLGSPVALNEAEALFFFANSTWVSVGETGLARIARDKPQASLVHAVGALFPQHRINDAKPWNPGFQTGGFSHAEQDGTYLYLYGCGTNPNAPSEQSGGAHCRVARVLLAEARDGSRYRYWDGASWNVDVQSARVVLDHMPGGFSVSHNRYLQRFVIVATLPNNTVELRTSERPEGPWKQLGTVSTIPATGGFGITFGAVEHPALRGPCQQVLYITYVLPLKVTNAAGMSTDVLQTQLLRVRLE